MSAENYCFTPVWDPVLRFLHWWNVSTMTVQVATGGIFMLAGRGLDKGLPAQLGTIHAIAGFLFGAGLVGRVFWLFVGPKTASWQDLLPLTSSQRRAIAETLRFYLRGFKGNGPLYLAHNAFAGLIYAAFFVVGAVSAASGSVLLALPDKLRGHTISKELHETCFILILGYIAAHLAAVFLHELTERHGLVAAMIHGKKTFTAVERETLDEEHHFLNKGGDNDWKD